MQQQKKLQQLESMLELKLELVLELESLEVHRCIPADKEYLIFLFASVRAASEPLKVVQVVGCRLRLLLLLQLRAATCQSWSMFLFLLLLLQARYRCTAA